MDKPTSNRKQAQNISQKCMPPWWLLSGMFVSLGSQAAEQKEIQVIGHDQGLEGIASMDCDTEASSLLNLEQSTQPTPTSVNQDLDGELLVEPILDEEELALIDTEEPNTSSVAYTAIESSENEMQQNEAPGLIEVMTVFAAGVFLLGTKIADNYISQDLPEDQNGNVVEYNVVEHNGGGSSNQTQNNLTLWAGYPGAFDPAMYDVNVTPEDCVKKVTPEHSDDKVKNQCKDSLLYKVIQFNDHYKVDGMVIGKVIAYMSSPTTDKTDQRWEIFEPNSVVNIINAFSVQGIKMDIMLDYSSFSCEKKSKCGEYPSTNVTKTSTQVNELTNDDWNPGTPDFDKPTSLHSALQWFAEVVNDTSLQYTPALVIDPETGSKNPMKTADIQQLIYYIDEFRYNYTYDTNQGKYFELGMTIDHASKSQAYGNVTSFPSPGIDTNLKIYSLEGTQGSLINNKGELIYRISSQPEDKPAHGEEPLVNDMYLQMYARNFDYWMQPLQGETIDCGDSSECLNMALHQIPIKSSSGVLTYLDRCLYTDKKQGYLFEASKDDISPQYPEIDGQMETQIKILTIPKDSKYIVEEIYTPNALPKCQVTLPKDYGLLIGDYGTDTGSIFDGKNFYYEQSPAKYTYPPVINQEDVDNIYMMFSFQGDTKKQFFADSTGKPLDPTSFKAFLDGFVNEYTGNEFYMYEPSPGADLKPITNPIKSPSGGSDIHFLKDNFAIFEYKWLFEDPDTTYPDWFGPFP